MRLRYRLMPYLYSLAASAHFEDGTLMRGLPMDYPQDPQVRDLSDQWMLGPALMPCPVSEYKARSREVYFPEGGWYDFYTGEYWEGGIRRTVAAPYERIPLYVRAGSIVPVGPAIEWTSQETDGELFILVYAGADACFTLYEDDGLSYDYEKGAYSTIPLRWNEEGRILTIGRREGSFPGMHSSRVIRVKVVDPQNPAPFQPDATDAIYVNYDGKLLTLGL